MASPCTICQPEYRCVLLLRPGTTCGAKSSVIKYSAFVSSCHCDEWWSKRLCAALEGYRIANDLVGRKTRAGRLPKVAAADLKNLHRQRNLSLTHFFLAGA